MFVSKRDYLKKKKQKKNMQIWSSCQDVHFFFYKIIFKNDSEVWYQNHTRMHR